MGGAGPWVDGLVQATVTMMRPILVSAFAGFLIRSLLEAEFLSTGLSPTVSPNFVAGDHFMGHLKARERQTAPQ